MVLKVPRLNFSPLALCDRPFSLLGFGDVLVPGNELSSRPAGSSKRSKTLPLPYITSFFFFADSVFSVVVYFQTCSVEHLLRSPL